MSSKINKKMSVIVDGILGLDDGIITLEVQGVEGDVVLADLIKDFENKTVKITVAFGEEL